MIDTRVVLVIAVIGLLAGCDNAPDSTSTAAGEVLEGTVSDAMLPVDRLRSEPPLEDPAAFAEAQADAGAGSGTPGGADTQADAAGEQAEGAEAAAADAEPGAAAPEPGSEAED